jgi:hypothetical protein
MQKHFNLMQYHLSVLALISHPESFCLYLYLQVFSHVFQSFIKNFNLFSIGICTVWEIRIKFQSSKYVYLVFSATFVEGLSVPPIDDTGSFVKNQWIKLHGLISGSPILFHWLTYLFLFQYYAVCNYGSVVGYEVQYYHIFIIPLFLH